jgi:hypothetical protein
VIDPVLDWAKVGADNASSVKASRFKKETP